MSDIKFCPKCDSPIADGANFCVKCGLDLRIPGEEAPEKTDEAETAPAEDDMAKKYGSGGGGRTIVVVLLIVMGLIAIGKCAAPDESTIKRYNAYPTTSSKVKVKYELTGNVDSASITYSNATGATVQNDNAKVPQSFGFEVESGQFLYLSAQNNLDYGTIGCVIYVDGVVVQEAESEGAYVIATCSGSVR